MLPKLPLYSSLTFGLTTFLTVWLICRATPHARSTGLVLLGWLVFQAVLGLSGFYRQLDAMPPRVPVLLVPPLLLIISLFSTRRGHQFIDTLRLDRLTILHSIRIPVEVGGVALVVSGQSHTLLSICVAAINRGSYRIAGSFGCLGQLSRKAVTGMKESVLYPRHEPICCCAVSATPAGCRF